MDDKRSHCENITVRNSIMWSDQCCTILLGDECRAAFMRNIVIEDCLVPYLSYEGYPKKFLMMHSGEEMRMENIRIEDIEIGGEGQDTNYIEITTEFNKYSKTKTAGYIEDVLLKNLHLTGKEGGYKIVIRGYDRKHCINSVTFENCTINGKLISDTYPGLQIGEFTKKIRYHGTTSLQTRDEAYTLPQAADPEDRTGWFMQSKYGVMMHFLVGAKDFDLVSRFDVNTLADQLEEAGAGYFLLTLGQNSGYYCSPNAVYDKYTSHKAGERCSTRDLPMDLYQALHPKGIKLMLYLPANPPNREEVCRAFGWDLEGAALPQANPPGQPTQKSVERWADVIREWSLRYGDKVAGWWFDGARREFYDNRLDQGHEWLGMLASAARAGNPDAILGFNPGKNQDAFGFYTTNDDYIAGHDQGPTQLTFVPSSRFIRDSQWHALVYMGQKKWGSGGERFPTKQWLEYCQSVFDKGGVVTFDIGKNKDVASGRPVGAIAEEHLEQLETMKKNFKEN
jgi:hypothetical protein